MKEFAESLERLAQLFRDGELQDPYANEIVYLLEDKAHDIKLGTEEADDGEVYCGKKY